MIDVVKPTSIDAAIATTGIDGPAVRNQKEEKQRKMLLQGGLMDVAGAFFLLPLETALGRRWVRAKSGTWAR